MAVPVCLGCAARTQVLEQLRAAHAQRQAERVATKAQRAAAKKAASNSSKPPSSARVKKPKDKPKDGQTRKRGGPPGHPRHQRQPFAEEGGASGALRCRECPACQGPVVPSKAPPTVWPPPPGALLLPSERSAGGGFRSHACWCRKGPQVPDAPLDEAPRRAGRRGPRLTSRSADRTGAGHCSYATLRTFIRAVLGLTIRRGYLANRIAKASALPNAGDELAAEVVWRVPPTAAARNLAHRFAKQGARYLRFITTPGIAPTTPRAEQALRFVVLDRKVPQGTGGDHGQRGRERLGTVRATCAHTGRDVLSLLHQALSARRRPVRPARTPRWGPRPGGRP